MKIVQTDYNDPIQIGTREDDGRFAPTYLFIQTGDYTTRKGLNKDQALTLVAVLVDAIREIQ